MAITPTTYTPSGSLLPSKAAATPYSYGGLSPTTSAYNIWGSTGNPYLIAGPSYTPGAGAPIVPRPVAPVPRVVQPVDSGGDSAWTNGGSSTTPEQQYGNLQSWIGRDKNITRGVGSLFGAPLLDPAIDFAYGINPINQKSLSWYGGSTDFDNNVYSDKQLARNNYSGSLAAYQADKAAGMTDQTWAQRWAEDKGTTAAPVTFGNPNSALAQQATAGIATDKQRVVDNKQKIVDIEQAAKEAEQAKAVAASRLDAAQYTEYTNKIDSLTAQLGDLQSVNSQQYTNLLGELETVEGELTQRITDIDAANNTYYNNTYNQTFAPNDVVTGDTGTWTNPAANTDTSTLSGSTGTTNSSFTNDGSGGVSFSSDETGTVSGTDYGDGQYGFTDTNGEEVGYEDPDGGGDSGGGGGGGGSYIATAATQSLGTEGLTVFNNWRDYMHSWHPTFTTSFGRYRVTAPKIVKAIDSKDNSKELYKEIWDEYLLPIHKLIVDKDDTNALVKYKVMVKELMNKYLKGGK